MTVRHLFDASSAGDAEHPIGVRAYQLPTFFVKFLRAYFQPGFPKWIESLDRLCWVGEDGPSELAQNTQAIEIYRLADHRKELTDLPKIVVERGPVSDQTQGLAAGQKMVRPIAQERYESTTAGTLTFIAASRSYAESELIAFEVFELIRHFRQELRDRLCLSILKPSQVGQVGSMRDFPDFFIVPVTIEYLYRDNVEIVSDMFPIRELVFRVNVEE